MHWLMLFGKSSMAFTQIFHRQNLLVKSQNDYKVYSKRWILKERFSMRLSCCPVSFLFLCFEALSNILCLEARVSGGFFKNKFVDTLLFLEEFQLKDSSEKQVFFKSLQANIELFPDEIAKYKILPKLIHVCFFKVNVPYFVSYFF